MGRCKELHFSISVILIFSARAAQELEAGENLAESEQQKENMEVGSPALPVKLPALAPQAAPTLGSPASSSGRYC